MSTAEEIRAAAFDLARRLADADVRRVLGHDSTIIVALEDEFLCDVLARVEGVVRVSAPTRLLVVRAEDGFHVFEERGFIPTQPEEGRTDDH